MNRMKRFGKLYGAYQLLTPILYIHDPELIKQVMIKDFPSFMNRFKLRTYHELLNLNLFFAENEKWKRNRSIASPSFTTGKLRFMSATMNKSIVNLFDYFDEIIDQANGIIETKKVIAGFTMDVIARTGFGVDVKTNNKRSDENEFFKHGIGIFRSSPFRVLASLTFPLTLNNLLNIRYLGQVESVEYFITLTKNIVRQRKKLQSNAKPTDLLQLMLEANVNEESGDNFNDLAATMDETESEDQNTINTNKKTLTEEEVIANSIFFLIAGFETTSSTISHCMFELASNENIQNRLYQELKDVEIDDVNSKEFYNKIMNGLPYLEAVVKETMRKYPPVTNIIRRVNVDEFKLNNITLKRDYQINMPVHAIHHCEEYYSQPEQFNPDRFMPENSHKLIPYTYMPFGIGPRNCIGMRFAYQEIKLCIAQMVKKYRFETTVDTPKILKFAPRSILLQTEQFKLKIQRR